MVVGDHPGATVETEVSLNGLSTDALAGTPLAVRELIVRGSGWLAAHGAFDACAEMRERFGERAGRAVVFNARPADAPDGGASMELVLELDDMGDVVGSTCSVQLHDRRKPLRRTAKRVPKLAKGATDISLTQKPEAGKHDPAMLTVVVSFDPKHGVEELVSRGVRLLDQLAIELDAQRPGQSG
jgi:hypothetical protein